MSTTPNKIIYSMVGVGKYYDKKPVIKDIYLSYFYGAKIGVIGLNGSGKSSLLRIIAGESFLYREAEDTEINANTPRHKVEKPDRSPSGRKIIARGQRVGERNPGDRSTK